MDYGLVVLIGLRQPAFARRCVVVGPVQPANRAGDELQRQGFGLRPGRLAQTGSRERMEELSSVLRYLRPEFLEEISESCVIEQV